MENQKPDTRYRSLSLWNVSFAFAVLAIGLGFAFLAFLSCLIYFKWIKNKDTKNESTRSAATEIELLTKGRLIEVVVDNEKKINNATNDEETILSAADTIENHNLISAADIEKAIDKIKENVPIEEGTRQIEGEIAMKI